jgi:hypothetical protein
MFDYAIDIRDQLARGPGGPAWTVDLRLKTGLVVHYNGPPVAESRDEREYLRAVADYHVARDWNSRPGTGPVIRGDGVMYHIAVGRRGDVYRLRDLGAVLWHCGSWPENQTYLSVLVILGGEQRATPAQLTALYRVCDEWTGSAAERSRLEVIGHQEVDWTPCPGTLMDDFVLRYRGVIDVTTDGRMFTETGFYVGGPFWSYWRDNGGLMIFGFPLSDELEEEGRTVQYFERCVMEWHPDNPVGFRVLLRRLGAQALRVARA